MGKRKLLINMVIGTVIGGLVALRDPEVRTYAKEKLSSVKSTSTYFIKNPSEAVRNTRIAVDQFNHYLSSGARNTINALEQVEDTLDKAGGEKEEEQDLHIVE